MAYTAYSRERLRNLHLPRTVQHRDSMNSRQPRLYKAFLDVNSVRLCPVRSPGLIFVNMMFFTVSMLRKVVQWVMHAFMKKNIP